VLDSTTIGVMKIEDETEINSPTVVKVAISGNKLIYASRSPIPFNRDGAHQTYFKHTGLYAFKKAGLREFGQGTGDLEDAEKVEILRLLENRVIVRTVEVPKYGSAVDTPEDLERVRSEF
jgi:3-deoxy-manno-octulosonate cytidylyltransferase (CMP-KDO synthetase)